MHHDRRALWLASPLMLLVALSTIYPMLFTLNTALKTPHDFLFHPFALTLQLSLHKFALAWGSEGMDSYFINSILVTAGGVAIVLLVCSMAGFALAQLSLRWKRPLFFLLLAGMMIPVQVVLVPLYQELAAANMVNSRLALALLYGAFNVPFGVYMMTTYYGTVPGELLEAARMDGASLWQIYIRIMLPLGRPALVTLGIITTLHCWNDILLSLLVLQDQRTLMVGISALQGEFTADIPLISAALVIGAAPVLLVFLLFQRRILGGLMTGAIKG